MQFPFDFWNVDLFLAVTSIVLLITSQLASSYEGNATILVDQKKLRTTSLVMGIFFLAVTAIHIYEMVTSR